MSIRFSKLSFQKLTGLAIEWRSGSNKIKGSKSGLFLKHPPLYKQIIVSKTACKEGRLIIPEGKI
jgi:hypothetical protein